FGGVGYSSAENALVCLNDLWKYDPSTNAWTWVSGSNTYNQVGIYGYQWIASPANIPGARSDSFSWTDSSGNFWLFGGSVSISPHTDATKPYNDLWKYDPKINEWTWMGGSNIPAQAGIYGTKGVASQRNIPGARYNGVSWTDSSGNFWLFGGFASPGD